MQKKIIQTISLLIVIISLISCGQEKKETTDHINWEVARTYYLEHITHAISYLDSLKIEGFNNKKSKLYFQQARIAFKKAEPYASNLNPEVGHRVNGPALPLYKEDNGKILNPVGFQKIEESIYEKETSNEAFNQEVYITIGLLTVLKKNIEKRTLNPERFFISTHQQLMRIVSLAMAGFDTPISQLSIKETAISLESLLYVYENTIESLIENKNSELNNQFSQNINKAILYIHNNPNFIDFDRFTFIRDYLNPITRNWVNIRITSNIWTPSERHPFNFNAPTFFDDDAFNANYFVHNNDRNPSEKQIALGKKLFFDTNVSKNGNMACATCHNPEKAYADGFSLGQDNMGNELQRNTPTLLNSIFQKSYFWDGRAETIIGQIGLVFTNEKEFDSPVHEFSNAILKDTSYTKLFKEAYGKIPKQNNEVIRALSSYVATLNGFNSKFDRNIRGEEYTFTNQEKNGFNIFMGKALCATCHFLPLTNGTVPPFFTETEKEVIGVPETSNNKEIDNDLGFYWKFNEALHKGMFKTPTIRNIALTAPYMHNGVYASLEQVIDFYNKGGGAGLGFNLPHQTLPFSNLNLSENEQKAIIAFMKTLTDNKRSY